MARRARPFALESVRVITLSAAAGLESVMHFKATMSGGPTARLHTSRAMPWVLGFSDFVGLLAGRIVPQIQRTRRLILETAMGCPRKTRKNTEVESFENPSTHPLGEC